MTGRGNRNLQMGRVMARVAGRVDRDRVGQGQVDRDQEARDQVVRVAARRDLHDQTSKAIALQATREIGQGVRSRGFSFVT